MRVRAASKRYVVMECFVGGQGIFRDAMDTSCMPWVNGNPAKRNRTVCPDDVPSTTKEGPLTLMGTSDQPCWQVRSSAGTEPIDAVAIGFGSGCFAADFFPKAK